MKSCQGHTWEAHANTEITRHVNVLASAHGIDTRTCCAPATPTFVDPVAAAVHLALIAHFLHVGAMVRREVHERVVRQAQAVERIQDLPCGGRANAVTRDAIT